jgi:hypothetical protein
MTEIASSAATPIAGTVPSQLVLTLEGMRYRGGPVDTYDVYFNLPPDIEPDRGSEYFVGSIYLFGLLLDFTHGMPGEGMRQDFVVNSVARTSQERGELQGDPVVTFAQPQRDTSEESAATPGAATVEPAGRTAVGPAISIERATLVAVG